MDNIKPTYDGFNRDHRITIPESSRQPDSSLRNFQGIVYLIGAGPGDPGLLTVKAKRALMNSEAVVYDHLVSLELIVTLPPEIELHYAGKSAGNHSLPQDEINALLAKLAGEGKRVARLKGGDPFVFGRGGEEAIYLNEHGIDYEIIPGVTAGVAASAYAGIPVTHRGKAVFTVFLTAHESPDKNEPQIPWDTFSKLENGTLVGYMGVGRLQAVSNKLIEGGMRADLPAAVIEKGTLGTQRAITGTLTNIAGLAKESNIKPPAIFVFGEVVSLREDILPHGSRPLSGKTIMVTRPGDQAEYMYNQFRYLGAEVLPLPTISTYGSVSEKSWIQFGKLNDGWLIFTSENGVRYFFRQFFDHGFDIRKVAGFQIAVIGDGTIAALSNYGLTPDYVPSKYTVKTLTEELIQKFDWHYTGVIRVRGNMGDWSLEEALKEDKAAVFSHVVYENTNKEWDEGMWAAYRESDIDAVTFTSGSTAIRLKEILGETEFKELLNSSKSISIGPMTSEKLRELGVEPSIEAETHTVDGIIEAALKLF